MLSLHAAPRPLAALRRPPGGPFILPLAEEYGAKILPADSEHSAIFQVRHVGCCRTGRGTEGGGACTAARRCRCGFP